MRGWLWTLITLLLTFMDSSLTCLLTTLLKTEPSVFPALPLSISVLYELAANIVSVWLRLWRLSLAVKIEVLSTESLDPVNFLVSRPIEKLQWTKEFLLIKLSYYWDASAPQRRGKLLLSSPPKKIQSLARIIMFLFGQAHSQGIRNFLSFLLQA